MKLHVVRAEDVDGGVTLALRGDLDLATADDLRSAVTPADRSRSVRLDLGGVEFLDSSGIGALIGIKRELQEAGGVLVVTRVSDRVRRALELIRMDSFFDVDRLT
jgi:anti-anti-sigma factor